MSNNSVFKTGAKSLYSSIYNLWSDKKETYSDIDYMSDEDLYNDSNDNNDIDKESTTFQKKLNTGLLSKKKVLHIGATLQGIVQTMKTHSTEESAIHVPKLVVVGSQSSGKSSLLNGILSFDLLPTGKNMVTRTPLHMELIPSKKTPIAEFGDYNKQTGLWETIVTISFDLPVPSKEQRNKIREQIAIITNQLAGNECNISSSPIYLKIYAPNIPNLTMVDLPGMTMVACTDRGQPADIKEKINELLGSYIREPKTIILAVMPARTDIEADMALELIKRHDPEGERTIGILTKVDLMNINTDICDYLENNVSRDLQLKYGYYAIRNRTTEETSNLTVIEGFQKEKSFFKNHPTYNSLTGSAKIRLGIPNMTNRISEILVKNIKESLPHILTKVNERLNSINVEFDNLGDQLPESDEAKAAFAHNILTHFTRYLCDALNNRGSLYDTSRTIKELLIEYRKNIRDENPFSNIEENRALIETTIRNSAGNHMTSPSPPIEVLEQCLRDISTHPMMNLSGTSNKCIKDVCNCVMELIDTLLKTGPIHRFPTLFKKIKNTLNGYYIIDSLEKTRSSLDNLMHREENYIWTDNNSFHELLGNANVNNISENDMVSVNQIKQKKIDVVQRMNELLKEYYNTYIDIMANAVPKIIMYDFIYNIQGILNSKLNEHILKVPINELLEENGERAKHRKILSEERQKLLNIKSVIQEI
jgi:GTPase SAR1 family protein